MDPRHRDRPLSRDAHRFRRVGPTALVVALRGPDERPHGECESLVVPLAGLQGRLEGFLGDLSRVAPAAGEILRQGKVREHHRGRPLVAAFDHGVAAVPQEPGCLGTVGPESEDAPVVRGRREHAPEGDLFRLVRNALAAWRPPGRFPPGTPGDPGRRATPPARRRRGTAPRARRRGRRARLPPRGPREGRGASQASPCAASARTRSSGPASASACRASSAASGWSPPNRCSRESAANASARSLPDGAAARASSSSSIARPGSPAAKQ